MNKRGFTLLETLIVVSITGLVFAISIPSSKYLGNKLKEKKAAYELKAISFSLRETIDFYHPINYAKWNNERYIISIPFLAFSESSKDEPLCDDINYQALEDIIIYPSIEKNRDFIGGTFSHEQAKFTDSYEYSESRVIYTCKKGKITFINSVFNHIPGGNDFLNFVALEYVTTTGIKVTCTI